MADVTLTRFRAAPSFGWLWIVIMIVFCGAPALTLLNPAVMAEEGAQAVWITLGILVPLEAFFLLTLVSLPFMRYEITDNALVLRCGFLLRYRLPYRMISDVRRTTMLPSLWSSMRFPGLALWSVPYPEMGKVFMCAKRMSRDILLITVGSKRYGITPADEQAFMAALLPMLHPRGAVEPAAGDAE